MKRTERFLCRLLIGSMAYHAKLVTACPVTSTHFAKAIFYEVSDYLKAGIAPLMTELIVDIFEIIQIKNDDCI